MSSKIIAGTTSGTALNMSADTSGVLEIQTGSGPTTAITVDASQNVGVGTSTPSSKLSFGQTGSNQVGSQILLYDAGSASNTNNYGFAMNPATGELSTSAGVSGFITWYTGTRSERMRLTSTGRLGIGNNTPNCSLDVLANTSASDYQTVNIFNQAATSTSKAVNRIVRIASNGNGADSSIQFTDSVSNNYFFGGYFGVCYVSANNNQGVKLSAGATSWAADSDERLKNIKAPITNAIENLSTLRTVYGNYKTDADDVSRLFLIAQDVEKVYPETIDVGQDEDKTLGLRAVDLIPVLVAAVKELNAKVTALETQLGAK